MTLTVMSNGTAETSQIITIPDRCIKNWSSMGFFYTESIIKQILPPGRPLLKEEGNVLFNDALNTFYLWLYCVGHMVKDHSESVRGNQLPRLHQLLFLISSKGSFICIIPQTG